MPPNSAAAADDHRFTITVGATLSRAVVAAERQTLAAEFANAYADDSVATFPAKHADVGDVVVAADEGEVIVYVGEITHGHFNAEYGPTAGEGPEAIVPQVVAFLDSLFSDRVLLWQGWLNSGGWKELEQGAEPKRKGKRSYVWSGPIT